MLKAPVSVKLETANTVVRYGRIKPSKVLVDALIILSPVLLVT